ncbi:MAG: CDP-diacylglycerol--glycerol-3-phosphate 3-phosphatidyltransferase [Dehalococcoidia bacterium]
MQGVARPATALLRQENGANLLTALRLALAVPVAVLILLDSSTAWLAAAVLFAVAGVTDLLDGYVARRWGAVSALGGFLDPLADKCVIDGALIALALHGAFPSALAGLFIARDLVVTLLRLMGKRETALFSPGHMAKGKTCALYLGVGGVILGRHLWPGLLPVAWLCVAGAAVLSLISAAQYGRRAALGPRSPHTPFPQSSCRQASQPMGNEGAGHRTNRKPSDNP